MSRGRQSLPGDRTTNKNGYTYEKVEGRGWVGVHILLMEKKLGRELQPGEKVIAKNGFQLTSQYLTVDMLELRTTSDRKSKASRIAVIEDRIEQLQAELEILREEENA